MTFAAWCSRAAVFLLGAYTILTVALPWGFDLAQWIAETVPWLLSAPHAGVTAVFRSVSSTVASLVPPAIRAGVDALGLGLGLILLMLGVIVARTSIWLKLAALTLGAYVVATLTGSMAQKLKIPLALRTPEIVEFWLILAAVVLFVIEVIRREPRATPRTGATA